MTGHPHPHPSRIVRANQAVARAARERDRILRDAYNRGRGIGGIAIPEDAQLSIRYYRHGTAEGNAQAYFDAHAADPHPWAVDAANLLPREVLENRTILQYPRNPHLYDATAELRMQRLLAAIDIPTGPYQWRPHVVYTDQVTGVRVEGDGDVVERAPWARRRAMGVPVYTYHPEPPPQREPGALAALVVFMLVMAAIFITLGLALP